MKKLVILLLAFLPLATLADELDKAYEREYAYLVAEKKALEQRLADLKSNQTKTIRKVKKEIDQLQSSFLKQQNLTDRLNREIVEASRGVDFADNDNALLETTLIQARESLKKLAHNINDEAKPAEHLIEAMKIAEQVIQTDGSIQRSEGQFFAEDGKAQQGQILTLGRIARFASGEKTAGILAPSGDGHFRIWDAKTAPLVKKLLAGEMPSSIDVFLYDNVDKGIEKQEAKGFEDDLEAGGLVGLVILVLGSVGVLLVLIRSFLLIRSSSNLKKLTVKVNKKIEKEKINGALKICAQQADSASKVIGATLRNLDKDRDHIEDIVSESILHESSRIDRFGTLILVIAAVSPLLGLLGTVTGMISTFDIITEFGTGDPKLLSSGISEALVTTKFGLVVAIPMLFLGNFLSSWAQRIKTDLEQAALHMINTHKAL